MLRRCSGKAQRNSAWAPGSCGPAGSSSGSRIVEFCAVWIRAMRALRAASRVSRPAAAVGVAAAAALTGRAGVIPAGAPGRDHMGWPQR